MKLVCQFENGNYLLRKWNQSKGELVPVEVQGIEQATQFDPRDTAEVKRVAKYTQTQIVKISG